MRILVVDDEIHLVRSLERGLRLEGYEVVGARSAVEALRCLDTGEKIDLVVTDYIMPEMDGIELIQRIREKDPGIPMILMSVHTGSDLLMNAIRLDCRGFLEKPFSLEELLTAIEDSAVGSLANRLEKVAAPATSLQPVA